MLFFLFTKALSSLSLPSVKIKISLALKQPHNDEKAWCVETDISELALQL